MTGSETENQGTVWIFVGIVAAAIVGVLWAVINHASEKPASPQALVAAALNRPLIAREWKPGMGPEPLIYHPAAAAQPFAPLSQNLPTEPQPFMNPLAAPPVDGAGWRALYLCPTHGATYPPRYDGNGAPYCPTCNQLMVTNK